MIHIRRSTMAGSVLLVFLCSILTLSALAQTHAHVPPAFSEPLPAPPASEPSVKVSPSFLDFGPQSVGSTSPVQVLTLTATSEGPVKVSITQPVGDFDTATRSCDLEPSGACAIDVSFAPKKPGETRSALTLTLVRKTSSFTTVVPLAGEGISRCVGLKNPFTPQGILLILPALVVALLYLLGLILVRWNMVALPTRKLLIAEIESVRKRMEALQVSAGATPIGIEKARDLLGQAEEFLRPKSALASVLDYLFWTRGQELAGWGCVHEAEEQMASFLPEETVRVELGCAGSDLRQVATPTAVSLADEIHEALATVPPVPLDRLRALLAEARGLRYDRTDSGFAALISWHNKTVWLIGCGLLFMVSLVGALQHEIFFLLGATGGLLSRLSRTLYREDVPTDYGASWTTLFLSPVVGALAGWSGVLLVILAFDLNLLGPIFKIDWCNPYSPVTLALAFLLGFSERAFDTILTQLEDKVKAQPVTGPSAVQIPLRITTPGQLPNGTVGQAYAQTLSASGGKPPYRWNPQSGSLPAGLVLDPTGRITGTPTAASTLKFALQVSDATSKTVSQEFTIAVA